RRATFSQRSLRKRLVPVVLLCSFFYLRLTKKFGAILLLLTAGSLAGVVTFALFFVRTAGDGLYLVAAQIEHGILQQLQIQTLAIRDGQEAARPAQLKLIEGYDVLINAMQDGGRNPARPVDLMAQVAPGS